MVIISYSFCRQGSAFFLFLSQTRKWIPVRLAACKSLKKTLKIINSKACSLGKQTRKCMVSYEVTTEKKSAKSIL